MEKIVLINATSCAGGGIKILSEFVSEISNTITLSKDYSIRYYFFVPDSYTSSISNKNINIIKNSENQFYKNRNYWNLMGFKKWVTNSKVDNFDLISLQNYFPEGVVNKARKKTLYLHQSIPFHEKKWGIWSKKERRLWFYKHIYYQLIKKSVRNADEVIVQTEWFKNQISLKLNYTLEKITVKRPRVDNVVPNDYRIIEDLRMGKKLFYPAGGMIYKNHEVILNALDILINKWGLKNIYMYFTLNNQENDIVNLIKRHGLENNVILTGQLSFDQVMSYYNSVDILLFPSEIESFGLPLVEAQRFNLPIICNDIDLFREVVGEYKGGVQFCQAQDSMMWAKSIKKLLS